MVSVCFHPLNIPVILLTGVKNVLLDILPEPPSEQLFSVLCGKDQMNHEQVLVVPAMLINVQLYPLFIDNHQKICYYIYGDNNTFKEGAQCLTSA